MFLKNEQKQRYPAGCVWMLELWWMSASYTYTLTVDNRFCHLRNPYVLPLKMNHISITLVLFSRLNASNVMIILYSWIYKTDQLTIMKQKILTNKLIYSRIVWGRYTSQYMHKLSVKPNKWSWQGVHCLKHVFHR